jgi:hypothetical protein
LKSTGRVFHVWSVGHYANKFSMKQTGNEDERHAHVTRDSSTFITYQLHATRMVGKFKKSEVLLDNQVDVSVIHPSLLREIEQAESSSVNINGVGVSCTYRGECLSLHSRLV